MNTQNDPDTFPVTLDDGVEIAVRRAGNTASSTRLFITHGNGFAIDGYRVFWEPLLADYDVVLFDMRNHGRNPHVGADGHHYLQLARDIGTIFKAVTSRLGQRKNVGIFHSMSARAAMKHAVEVGWIWDALVLFDPPNVPPRGHPHYEPMRIFEIALLDWALKRRERFGSPAELMQYYTENRSQSRWVPQSRQDMAHAILRRDQSQNDWELSCRRELEAGIYLAALTVELWPRAEEFAGPVKLIGADPHMKGTPATAAANRALAEENGFVYEAIGETGHLLQIERPDACRASVLSFLKELGLSR